MEVINSNTENILLDTNKMKSDPRPPGQLSDQGQMARNWRRWKNDFLTYMKQSGGANKPGDEKVACLKNLIGPVGMEALDTVCFYKDDHKENISIVMKKLGEYFDPPKNEFLERNKFFMRSKTDFETFSAYIDALKVMAKDCNFYDKNIENRVIDAIILNTKDRKLQKMFFEEKNLNLTKVKTIYKRYQKSLEITPAQKQLLDSLTKGVKSNCWRCGERHPFKYCPARKNLCCYCQDLHHFSDRCPLFKLDTVKKSLANNTPLNKLYTNNSYGFAPAISEPRNACSKCGDRHVKGDCPVKQNNCSNCKQFNDFWCSCPVAEKKGVEMLTVNHTASDVTEENSKSDPLLNDFEVVEAPSPTKIQNEFSTSSNKEMQQTNSDVQNPQPSQATYVPQNSENNPPSTARSENSKPSNNNNSASTYVGETQPPNPKEKESECVIS